VGCPKRWPVAWLSACSCALAVAGCGGTEATPRPTIDAAVAEQLAADADTVAARLDAGDPCGAAERAAALQQATIQALNARGQVPDELKEDLGLAVADLVDRAQTECTAAQPPPAPPPPTTTEAEEDEDEDGGENGRGRGKGKGKGKRD
jgi:hypothetical protein